MGRPWFVRSESAHPAPHPPQRICFFFNAQIHQLFHALPVAIQLSRNAGFAVDVLAATEDHIALARDMAAGRGAGPIRFRRCGGADVVSSVGATRRASSRRRRPPRP